MNVLADAASYASASASISSADNAAADNAAADNAAAADTAANTAAPEDSTAPKKGGPKKKTPKLQHILMKLLNEETHPDCIWWLPGEKEFAINADKFPAILDAHLPGTKYASFIRRLHKLGFSRQTRSLKKVYGTLPEHAVAFHHEKFRRDKPELMDELKNGYWKECKAKKARVEAESSRTESPPSVVSVKPLESISSRIVLKKPTSDDPDELMEYAEALRRKNQIEQNEREIQLMLLRQRVAAEQAEMEQLLLLRQQRQQQEAFMAILQQQQQWATSQTTGAEGASDASPPDSTLMRLQAQAQFPGFVGGFRGMY